MPLFALPYLPLLASSHPCSIFCSIFSACFLLQLYERCRQEQPDAFSKVTVVTGDILEPGLGLSESDVELLVENATVVIHSAATVRFQDHVR